MDISGRDGGCISLMVKLSLKGQFKVTGEATFQVRKKKVKVLKQLENQLFVCGDRDTPELAYTIPAGKRAIFARIDNIGTGLDDWKLAVFLMPESFPYQDSFDYNQQTQKTVETEVVYIGKGQDEVSFFLSELGEKTAPIFEDTKLYTGNHSLCQIDVNRPAATTITIKVNNSTAKTLFENDGDIRLGTLFKTVNYLPNDTISGLIFTVSEPKSSGRKEKFFIQPYHKLKGIYSYQENENLDAVRLYEVQTFELKKSTQEFPVVTYHMPEKGSDNVMSSKEAKDAGEFFKKCGQPRDTLNGFFCQEPSPFAWYIGGWTSFFRGFPTVCQHQVPPYPTFLASCEVVAELEWPKYIWCPDGVGGTTTQFVIGNYKFEQTPPFGGELSYHPTKGVIGTFIPDPSSFNVNTLSSGMGGKAVRCMAEGGIYGISPPDFLSDELNEKWLRTTGLNPNKDRADHFESRVQGWGASSTVSFLLDMKSFSRDGQMITSCTRPDLGGQNKGDNPKFKGGYNEYGFYDANIEEYFITRYLVAVKMKPWNVSIIPLTDTNNNYDRINVDIEGDLKQTHGLSFVPEKGFFYLIKADQKILNSDIATAKRKTTSWQITEIDLPYTGSSTTLKTFKDPSKIPPIKTRVFNEEVLPLGSFDKIWSYSYYSS